MSKQGGFADIPACVCVDYYDDHHPECPVRREVEGLRSRLSAGVSLIDKLITADYDDPIWNEAEKFTAEMKQPPRETPELCGECEYPVGSGTPGCRTCTRVVERRGTVVATVKGAALVGEPKGAPGDEFVKSGDSERQEHDEG